MTSNDSDRVATILGLRNSDGEIFLMQHLFLYGSISILQYVLTLFPANTTLAPAICSHAPSSYSLLHFALLPAQFAHLRDRSAQCFALLCSLVEQSAAHSQLLKTQPESETLQDAAAEQQPAPQLIVSVDLDARDRLGRTALHLAN